MSDFLRFEFGRALRNRRYYVFGLVMPTLFYLVFTKAMPAPPGTSASAREHWSALYMVSMACFGAIGSVLGNLSPTLVNERATGWARQLRLLRLSGGQWLAGKLAVAMTLAALALGIQLAVAGLGGGVSLSAGRWALLAALLWAGCLPFAALGIMLGQVLTPENSYPVTSGAHLVLALLGGLWLPVSVFPSALREVAQVLPSYRLGSLGWSLVLGGTPSELDGVVLIVFAVLAGAAAWLLWRARWGVSAG
ncbi:ABC-2 type transport system permease protein [Kitasatospora sp. MAA4]|uniref:ABC transporter permease n=1 Tax=Kitasatospora sp. MAA4 TaxID=3035093 RepID=UPI002476F2E6|nr:ABC transporter permease [Kitasatospora sp. MAA4]MDH6137907.1 ABC-2 type transport system permease protein [Kitasatospora sp. MAA4]